MIHFRLSDARTKQLVRWLAEGEGMDITQWLNSLIQERIELLTKEDLSIFEQYWRAANNAAQRAREIHEAKKAVRKR